MSSLLDFEISQKVWNAKLPIKILFDIQEVEEYANDTKWNPIFVNEYFVHSSTQWTHYISS
jgi:autophagy-related protein 5